MTETLSREAFRQLQAQKPKRSKYRAQPVIIDGIRFPSAREGERWRELQILQRTGAISNLRRQVSFDLCINDVPLARYVSDFCYEDMDGAFVVEDAKGVETAMFKLKKKWMWIEHEIEIKTV
jgi:Protein of unknown function (DUF1064)